MYYSVFEQHLNGEWWYHPRFTFKSQEEAEESFKKAFWWAPDRPYKIIKHKNKLFQKYSSSTKDFKTLEFGGLPVGTIEQC